MAWQGMTRRVAAAALAAVVWTSSISAAQQTPGSATPPATQRGRGGRGPQGPQFTSPEVKADRTITFRVLAAQAERVTLNGGDIPNPSRESREFKKGENGVWELTVGPVIPGAFRYTFMINGVAVVDPRSPRVSLSNGNVWSLVTVPGSDFMDESNLPHGAVAAVHYFSKSLNRDRRMHVYTPPGYENSSEKYPIFYLLHGASDSDDSWTSVGRANFIFDNLIARKKIKPMVVVMPAGHTNQTNAGGGRRGGGAGGRPPRDEFTEDFVNDVMPYAESHYRVFTDRAHRAMAGLSMGGGQTMNIGFAHLDQFGYLGVFSSGIFAFGGGGSSAWEEQRKTMLDAPKLKEGLKVLWFRTGKDDGLLRTTRSTVDLLTKHGFKPYFEESEGGHTWINWRNYLSEFTPLLFQGT